mmetsp:Transcript_8475/g.25443  ORF Transcript_8475/g.25443 Transcript_8475/m.25443 type:complete len:265 (+) Transcript_8475:489-1283(+)
MRHRNRSAPCGPPTISCDTSPCISCCKSVTCCSLSFPQCLNQTGDARSESSVTERAEPEWSAGEGNESDTLMFDTRESGQLTVKRLDAAEKPLLQLSMPLNDPLDTLPDNMTPDSPLVRLTVGDTAVEALAFNAGLRYLVIQLKDGPASLLDNIKPDMVPLAALQEDTYPVFGIIVAIRPVDDPNHDHLVRFWAPWNLSWEDPVTGSAQSVVAPHFERLLGKSSLRARQASARGGELQVEVDRKASRVRAAGQAVIVLSGQLHL